MNKRENKNSFNDSEGIAKTADSVNKLCKFQIFTPERVHRSCLHEAEYNPREIDDASRKKLKQSVKEGLADAIVWNKKTGNVVGGHQRLSVLDELMKTKDYYLDVLAVDVDEKTEKKINIRLNNPNMSGSYDYEKLGALFIDDGIDFKDVGFTQADVEIMFNETELSKMAGYELPEEVKSDVEKIKKMKERRKTALQRYKNLEDEDYYVIMVFDTPENLKKFKGRFSLTNKEKYISGEDVAAKLGLELPVSIKDEFGRETIHGHDDAIPS